MKQLVLTMIALLCLTIGLRAQTAEEAKSLHETGRKYLSEGKIAEGREYTKRAMDMRRELFGEVNEDYITSLNNYALSFCVEEDYAKAVELQEQVLALCGKLKRPHPNLGMYALNMGRFCYLNGDKRKAAEYSEQALPLTEKFGEGYELLLSILGDAYMELGDSRNLQRVMALVEEHNRHELSKECNEPACMLKRAQYYMSTGDNAKAKEHFLQALSMPMENEQKIAVCTEYARFLFSVKDYASAVEYQLTVAHIRKELDGGEETEAYADLLYKAAVYSYLGKAYAQAVEMYRQVEDFYAHTDSPMAQKRLAECYNGMGNAYSASKEYGKAKECHLRVVAYYASADKEAPAYPKAILNVAKAEKFGGEYDASIEHHLQAMKMFEERGMSEEYTDAANSLKLCYVYAGRKEDVDSKSEISRVETHKKLDRIIREELEHLDLMKTYFSRLAYARSLATIAGCYTQKEEYKEAIAYYKQYVEAVRDGVRDEFRMQGETERMATWTGEVSDDVRQLQQLLVMLPAGNESLTGELAALVYDVELLSKGILLNSAIEFEKVLAARGDEKLKAAYEQSKKNEAEIGRLRQHAATESDLDKLLRLTQENQALQLELYKGCAEFADFTNYISYGWKDVQQAMEETDVVIEFAAIGEDVFDSENYLVALVLTRNAPLPVAIPVCSVESAKQMEAHDGLFEMQGNPVWGMLSSFLTAKKRVFFSADGSFNRIGIEYLLYNGKPLSEQFEVYRLSSTKELCYRHERAKPIKAALFGNIDYDETEAPAEQVPAEERGAAEVVGLAALPNTLREIDEIQAVLERDKVSVSRFAGVEAGGNALKGLTGSEVNLLHIATHGMYREARNTTDAESMANSLLAFAGANVEDAGLVSASEVAEMDLRRCDLAVLSACETGLGKLGEDGVFGLQRGFKNAGVHTLLMSLKRVYDVTTADLMIGFYKHLMNGATKREALVKAQQEIRDKGYKEAKYWATFILLDAY